MKFFGYELSEEDVKRCIEYNEQCRKLTNHDVNVLVHNDYRDIKSANPRLSL